MRTARASASRREANREDRIAAAPAGERPPTVRRKQDGRARRSLPTDRCKLHIKRKDCYSAALGRGCRRAAPGRGEGSLL
jgi:hypothetical protein